MFTAGSSHSRYSHGLKRKQSASIEKELLKTIRSVQRTAEPREEKDESEIFCELVVKRMKQLDPRQIALAQRDIMDVLNEIQYGIPRQPSTHTKD